LISLDSIIDNKRPWMAALLIAITFFSVNGVLTYHSAALINKNVEHVSHTLQVINLIEQLKFHLFRAESGQRGYLITNDASYLDPYNESNVQARVLLTTLYQTETAIPAQKEKFSTLFKLLNEKLDEMQASIDYVEKKQSRNAVKLVKSDWGYKLTLRILGLLGDMETAEQEYLAKSRQENDETQSYIIKILLTANVVGLCLALLALYFTFRSGVRIQSLIWEVEASNLYLEDKVGQRTEELKNYSLELERSNKELEDFAFVASHDLQEPLRKIRAFGDRLSKDFAQDLGEKGQDYLARMQSASNRMSRLIEDLLTFSRVTQRQREFTLIDLNALIADVQESFDYAIGERNAVIEVSALPEINGDSSQLHQVFSNLLSNSLKFSKEDVNPKITIAGHLSLLHAKPFICVDVKDNGIGFDEQYKDRIFSLFQRLHGKDEYSGTGIGLAICRKIVENHGGKIEVESRLGEGTTFSLWFPLPAN